QRDPLPVGRHPIDRRRLAVPIQLAVLVLDREEIQPDPERRVAAGAAEPPRAEVIRPGIEPLLVAPSRHLAPVPPHRVAIETLAALRGPEIPPVHPPEPPATRASVTASRTSRHTS